MERASASTWRNSRARVVSLTRGPNTVVVWFSACTFTCTLLGSFPAKRPAESVGKYHSGLTRATSVLGDLADWSDDSLSLRPGLTRADLAGFGAQLSGSTDRSPDVSKANDRLRPAVTVVQGQRDGEVRSSARWET